MARSPFLRAVIVILTLTPFLPGLGTSVAHAQAMRASLEELTLNSSGVVVGHATRVESLWTPDRKRIVTEVTIRVDEHIRGQATSEMVLTIPGGRVGNTAFEVSDMPVFVEGESVVVFLWQDPTGKTQVTGGIQGKLPVIRDADSQLRVLSRTAELFQNPGTPGISTELSSRDLPLTEFIRRVKGVK